MKTRSLLLFLIAILTAIIVTAQSKMRIIEKSGSKTVVELNDVESINLFQEPWSRWQQTATASYTYSIYWSGTLSGANVRYRENLVNKNGAQFQFINMAGGYDLTIEYDKETGNCQVHQQQVADNSNYGPVFVCDLVHYPFNLKDGNGNVIARTYDAFPCHYDSNKGLFVLNLIYYVDENNGSNASGYFGYGVETIQMDGFYQHDYSFSMEYAGKRTTDYGTECALINVTMGADVSICSLAVVEANEDTDATVAGMLDGSIDCMTLIESKSVTVPLTKSGTYKAVAITYDDYDNMIDVHTMEFEFTVGNGDDNWVSLGMATYTDDLILPLFGNDPMSYNVEVLENREKPGLFRIVDPYGPEFPLYPYASSYADGTYIEIDATDPDGVWIEGWQSTGIDIANNGLMSVTSMAWYQADKESMTKEDAKEAGLCGVFADGVITFPVDGVLVGINSKAYYGNRNGAFRLDMSNLERPAETEEWKSIGMATYTDDLILPLFGNDPMSYNVEVLENKNKPGLFRIVDPYGPEFPLYPYASSYADGTYIEIDATDPEGVWIEGWQSTGLDIQNNGLMSITSMAWHQANAQGATKEDAKEAGLCGIYADGVITFPTDGLAVGVGENAYYGNRNGAFRLDMSNLERPAQTEEWKSLGMATYTEDCVTTFFNVENVSYQIEVRENTNQPGLYRIINPYGAAYPYNAEGDYDTSKEYFIEIDATDPEGVYIPGIYGTGMNWGYGEFSIGSMAYYYMASNGATFEEVKDAGYCGVLADGVITFPAKSLLISLSEYNGGNFYTSNNNGAFRLDMNDMTPAGAAPAKAAAARISIKRELNVTSQAVKPMMTLEPETDMMFGTALMYRSIKGIETPSMHKSTMKKAQTAREMFRTDAVIGIKDGGVARIKRVNENEEAIIDK